VESIFMKPRPHLLPLHPTLREAYDPGAFRTFGHALVDRLADHLNDSVGRRRPSSYPVGAPQEELAFWTTFMAQSGSRDEAIQAVLERSNQLHDPRYMGHQVAVPFPQEAMLGALTDLLNNGQAIYEMGPTNATLEHVLMNEVGQALGLPEGCSGVLCHGGTLGNLVALLAAQRKLGLQLDQDPWSKGIREADPFVVLVSE
jgi:L-2,4-diaminobutyrate decarboxylase